MKRLSAFVLCASVMFGVVVAAAPSPTVRAIDLRRAARFAVLAGQGVTNTDATIIKGDLGTWPLATAPTGFPPGVVNGTIHVADTAAENAQASLTIAYNDARGRPTVVPTIAGNLAGLTFTPGVYKSTSTLQITGGDVTLAGNGVYIFQIASGLTVNSTARVLLKGGAQAANVFWQVGSSATLGTYSVFKGTILALTSITIATGATMDGRALARNGNVTLDFNTITVPIVKETR